jgi:tetratricopeptide (TPR) repeat protein
VKDATGNGDWKPIMERFARLESGATDPTQVRLVKFQVLAGSARGADACATARQLLAGSLDASDLNMIAWSIATDLPSDDRDLKLALQAANKAAELSGNDPSILDTLARVHFEMGDAAKALDIQRRALEGAEKSGAPARQLDEMRAALKNYESAGAKKG